jgi:hypothetical protein
MRKRVQKQDDVMLFSKRNRSFKIKFEKNDMNIQAARNSIGLDESNFIVSFMTHYTGRHYHAVQVRIFQLSGYLPVEVVLKVIQCTVGNL